MLLASIPHPRATSTAGDDKRWQPASFPGEQTSREIDFDQLSGGARCRVMVVATDGVNTVSAESRPFAVPVKACQATILYPADDATYGTGEPVMFQGQGFYVEEKAAELDALVWASSKDGELGQGAIVAVPTLTSGEHVITLLAGRGSRVGRASISIRVGESRETSK